MALTGYANSWGSRSTDPSDRGFPPVSVPPRYGESWEKFREDRMHQIRSDLVYDYFPVVERHYWNLQRLLEYYDFATDFVPDRQLWVANGDVFLARPRNPIGPVWYENVSSPDITNVYCI